MNAHAPITLWHPSWPIRWEQAKGTALEDACLLSIAAETEHSERELHCLASDAVNFPDDRDDMIAAMEDLFAEWAEQEEAAEAAYAAEVRRGPDPWALGYVL